MNHVVICDLPGATIFFNIITNNTIFGRKLSNIKCAFLFSLEVLSEIFFILRRTERDMIINV